MNNVRVGERLGEHREGQGRTSQSRSRLYGELALDAVDVIADELLNLRAHAREVGRVVDFNGGMPADRAVDGVAR